MIVEVKSSTFIRTTAQLAHEIWTAHYEPIIGKEQVQYMLKNIQSEKAIKDQLGQGYRYFLLFEKDTAKGYLSVLMSGTKLMISKLYVASGVRGKGYGLQLLNHSKELALKGQCNLIWLTVNRHNAKSIEWYRNRGFTITDEKKFDIGNGFVMDDYILETATKQLMV